MGTRLKSTVRGALFGLIGAATVAAAATFNLFSPATGILKGNSSTYVTTAAGASDITSAIGSQAQNSVYAGPASGGAGAVAWRALVPADVPTLNQNTTGNAATATTATNIAGGLINQIIVQSGVGTSTFVAAPTTGGTALEWNGSAFIWATPSGTGCAGANPTGVVGLTAVNGSATSCTRSDGAPALSQAISPTWTGTHIFGGVPTSATTTGISLGAPNASFATIQWGVSGGATNSKFFQAFSDSTDWILQTVNDALNAGKTAIDVNRSANVVSAITLGNATDLPTIALDGATTITSTAQNPLLIAGAFTGAMSSYVTNTDAGTSSSTVWRLRNDASHDFQMALTSSAYSGTFLGGGPSGEQVAVYTNQSIPLVLGTNGSARVTISGAGLATFNAGTHGVVYQFAATVTSGTVNSVACYGGCGSPSASRTTTGTYVYTHNIGVASLEWTCSVQNSAGSAPGVEPAISTGSTTSNAVTINFYNFAGSLADPATGSQVVCTALYPT